MEKKEQHYVQKGKQIRLKEATLFSSRENIDEALEYFKEVASNDNNNAMHLVSAYYVLWNTLAKNYVLHEKSSDDKTREFNEMVVNRISESKYK